MADSKPRVVIFGGVGFIGRNLVKYLVDNNLCSKIKVLDKALPGTSYFNKATEEAFANPVVEYKQANLTNATAVAKHLADEGGKWNYVINCAAETKYSQTDEVYKEKVLDLSLTCYKEAMKAGCDKFIELSTAQVYDAGSKPSKEDGKIKPFTTQAKFKYEAEQALTKEGGPLVILRPATVYGPGDVSGLAPRFIAAAVYTVLKDKMEFLHDGDLKINTVHVQDVCKGIWLACEKAAPGSCYNLCDKNDTNQKKINAIIEALFNIKTGYVGMAINLAAKAAMSHATETVNDKHLKPWSDLCKSHNIGNTPLTPYLDQELLYNNNLSVDGSKIEKDLGMTYDNPNVTEALARDSLNYYIEQNLFPKII